MRLILMSTLCIINVAMTTRIMSAELNQVDKLIGTNYDMWCRKMKFLITEHDLSTYLTTAMVAPIEGAGTQAQYRHDLKTFEAWTKKDSRTHYIMLHSMHDGLIREFDNFPTTMAMWEQLKFTFGSTSITTMTFLLIWPLRWWHLLRVRALRPNTVMTLRHLKLELRRIVILTILCCIACTMTS